MTKPYVKPRTAPQIAPAKVTLYPYFFQMLISSHLAALDQPKTPVIVVKKIIIAPTIPPATPAISGFIKRYSTMFYRGVGSINILGLGLNN